MGKWEIQELVWGSGQKYRGGIDEFLLDSALIFIIKLIRFRYSSSAKRPNA